MTFNKKETTVSDGTSMFNVMTILTQSSVMCGHLKNGAPNEASHIHLVLNFGGSSLFMDKFQKTGERTQSFYC